MNNTQCPDCHQYFSRRDVMLRHRKTKHHEIIEAFPLTPQGVPQGAPPAQGVLQGASPPPPPQGVLQGASPPPPPQGAPQTAQLGEKTMIFQNPFTMMISGPTACGKTTFSKELLQQHNSRIQPSIHRIVWLYKRWQPMYTEIQSTVTPKVDFVQGIPTDLEDDDFFDPRLNNLLVMDDMYNESGKDKRITDLFTEGSHHRSLSVVSINQNLFGNKDPTQRRNCHYLVLFDNPVDRQTVMTLARQMYPGNTDKFQKAFTRATKNAYGYLLVDLKPFTSENNRLRYAIDWPGDNRDTNKNEWTNQIQEPTRTAIKDDNSSDTNHFTTGDHTVQIEQENTMANKEQACDDCGLLFDSTHDLQRHIKRGWCPENNEPPTKKAKIETNMIEEGVADNDGYKHLWDLAESYVNKNKFSKLYDQYMDNGENEDDAADMAKERLQPYKEKNFFERYQSLLEKYLFPMRTNPTHRDIIEQIEILRNKGTSLTSAVKRVLKRNKNAFEDLFEVEDSGESEDDMDSEGSE